MKGYSKKGYKGSGSYGNYRSGYIRPRDFMEPYRHPSKGPDEYDRRIRRELERVDASRPSGGLEPHSYRIERARVDEMSRKEIEKLTQDLLDKTIEEFKKDQNVEVLPERAYEVMQNAARAVGERFWLVQNDPNDSPTVVELVEELLPQKKDAPEDAELRPYHDSTAEFDTMTKTEQQGSSIASGGVPTEANSAEVKPSMDSLTSDLFDIQDSATLQKKRATSPYESDYDAV